MTWKEFLIFGGIFIGWFFLVRWVLPYFGVPTCMSGSCSVPRPTDQSCPFCSGAAEEPKNDPISPPTPRDDNPGGENRLVPPPG